MEKEPFAWIARNKDGMLYLYLDAKPEKLISKGTYYDNNYKFSGRRIPLDNNLFSNITWDSEPKAVVCIN